MDGHYTASPPLPKLPRTGGICRGGADKVSGPDFGHIGRRKPFSVPDTFSCGRSARGVFRMPGLPPNPACRPLPYASITEETWSRIRKWGAGMHGIDSG